MFGLFKKHDKLGKQTQSADVHNPIMRAAAEGQMNALQQDESYMCSVGAQQYCETAFWRASSLRNAEEVKRLSKALAIHEARYAKQMAGLKKATAAAAEKRRKV